ncbi:cytochrome b/b6 domain-containing protein [Brockia lithotrophica]|uniref:Formate dehydrogenase subunit gamma n=1 Tax=Brockia lithotrophica TaxID=933949 RepID=A0A660L6J6_9BACL|nr:cytochrome b/b6 domain-containing protein [Brockia lithotrophica]RKQ88452.1 formate dehydrogenase subunit gamma [Brockia lithotrophica]
MAQKVALKHSLPSQLMHFTLLVTWFGLAITGFGVYFGWVSDATAAAFMRWHVYFGAVLTFATLAYAIFAFDRAVYFLKEIFTWDRDTWLWWTNLGGYPYKFLKIGSPKTYPQSKYNAGQKFYAILVVFTVLLVIVTGWSLYYFPQALGKYWAALFFNLHVWVTLFVTLFMLFVHVPLALIMFTDFKAMFRFGAGYVPMEYAEEHSPKWAEKLVPVAEVEAERAARRGKGAGVAPQA